MRKAHILKGNKTEQRPRYRVYMDSESRVINKVHYPYLIQSCFIDARYNRRNWKTYEEEKVADFWRDVANYGGKKNSSVYIFGHNLGYDIIATGGIPVLCQQGFRVTNFFEKGITFILQMRKQEKYITREGEEKTKTVKTLNFISTTNFFPSSLAKLGEVFGLEKLEFDYDEGGMEAAKIYCRRDVEICMAAMESYIDFVDREGLGTLAKTTPGQAFNAYRHRFMPTEIYIHDNPQAIEIERNCYYGGRVECWRIGEFTGDFYGYDINSMYPYVMQEFTYPSRLLTVRKHNTIEEIKDILQRGFAVCGEFMVDVKKPVFPVKVDGNLLFPVGTFTTYLSTPEVVYGLENNLITAAGVVAVYEKEDLFSSYVKYFYGKRLEAKANQDEVKNLLYKLFLNSLYGKFGQKSDNWIRVDDAPIDKVGVEEIHDLDTGETVTLKIFGGSVFKKGEETEAFNSFCGVAAHVTAYARMVLLRYITLAGWDNIYYMDTDSLFVNKAGSDNLQAAGVVDPARLGALDLEKMGDYLRINSPKDYEFAGTKRVKGIKKGSRPLTQEEITSLISERKLAPEEVSDRIFETEQWPRLNSFIRYGDLSHYFNVARVKILKGDYNKGWVLADGRVMPFEMENGFILPYEQTTYYKEGLELMDGERQEKRINKMYKKFMASIPEEEYGQLDLLRQQMKKEFRAAVMALGGVNDPDFEDLPRWCIRRKTGRPLDYLAGEIAGAGWPVEDGQDLYDLIWENT